MWIPVRPEKRQKKIRIGCPQTTFRIKKTVKNKNLNFSDLTNAGITSEQ